MFKVVIRSANIFYTQTLFLSLVCPNGLGLESGSAIPIGMTISASSEESGKPAASARFNNTSAWCASTTNDDQYLSVDLGKLATVTGIAIQGDPTGTNNWVKTFSVKYGTSTASMATYKQDGTDKVCLYKVLYN